MHHPRAQRPPALSLLSSSAPARPLSTSPSPSLAHSQSPFRYLHHTVLSDLPSSSPTPAAPSFPDCQRSPSPSTPPPPQHQQRQPSQHLRQSAPLYMPYQQRSPNPQPSIYTHSPSHRLANLIKPWLPVLLYGITSLAFVVAIAFYRTQLFTLLDELSVWLRADKHFGHAVLFTLIFITTIPPFPLYSTLIVLSGYTFGPWTGALISYFAALTGAITVFLISRTLLRDSISRWLASTTTIKRVVRAIEKRPKLLFLIRLAPYPYNVMNCLLAASPSLTLRTYTLCTALSLFKVIIHTSVGASIHSFKDYHESSEADKDSQAALPVEESRVDTVARMWTIIGIALCAAILIYLSYVARKAVDEELDDEDPHSSEETLAFLSTSGSTDSDLETGSAERSMTEVDVSHGGQVFLLTQPVGSRRTR